MQKKALITVFQINTDRDNDRVCFIGTSGLVALHKEIKPEIYDKFWEGDLSYEDLEDIYTVFNCRRPIDYRGRSMSVSDIVRIQGEGDKPEYWFCDNFGFKQIDFEPYEEV